MTKITDDFSLPKKKLLVPPKGPENRIYNGHKWIFAPSTEMWLRELFYSFTKPFVNTIRWFKGE